MKNHETEVILGREEANSLLTNLVYLSMTQDQNLRNRAKRKERKMTLLKRVQEMTNKLKMKRENLRVLKREMLSF